MKIFHHNDMDGYTSLYITAKNVLSDINGLEIYNKDIFINVNYREEDSKKFDDVYNEDVYIVDYSFTESTLYQLKGLIDRGCKVTWIDHHESSIRLQEKYDLKNLSGIRDISVSAAALCYMYFNFKDIQNSSNIKEDYFYKIPLWIKYISDYDSWTHDYEESDHFKLGYDLYSDHLDLLYNIDKFPDMMVDKLTYEGELIKKYIDSENSFYCKAYGYESEMYDGTKCLVVNKRSNSWVFGDNIKKYPICIVAVFNGTEWQYSLFSEDENIDCSKYAEHYGGGGHKGAAGFRNKELLFNKINDK